MPEVAAAAAGAAPGAPRQGPGMWFVALQAASMLLLWNNWSNRRASAAAAAASNATLSSADLLLPVTTATPLPTPLAAVDPAAAPAPDSPPNLFSLLGMPDPTKARRAVPPELAYIDAARRARVAGLPPGSKLRNVWPPGVPFALYVFLSTSGAPITDFSGVDAVTAAWAAQPHAEGPLGGGGAYTALVPGVIPGLHVAHGAAATVSSSGGSGVDDSAVPAFSLLGGAFKRAMDRMAARGDVTTLPNATFDGLLLQQGGGEAAQQQQEEQQAEGEPAPAAAATALLWAVRGLTYDWAPGTVEQHVTVALPRSVRANASGLYAHVYAVAAGSHPDPTHRAHAGEWSVAVNVHPLVTLVRRRPRKETYSLLGGGGGSGNGTDSATATSAAAASPAAAANETRVVPHWRPTLSTGLIVDHSVHGNALPPPLDAMVTVVDDPPTARHAGGGAGYLPPLVVDTFWLLSSQLVEVNASVATVPLRLSYSPFALWRFALASQMESQLAMQEAMGGGGGGADTGGGGEGDLLKSILLDTNPLLLVVTAAVSLLHMVFEFLAFRNDVSFWRGVKSTAGLSVRSIAMSFVTQAIILLYLADNDTSWMVLLSSGIGLAIEGWKLRKAVTMSLSWWQPGGSRLWLPWVDVTDKDADDAATSATRRYDDIATRHMLVVLVPLVVGQAAYSLVHETHRSWYSWAISSLTR
jgi:hypothetical protein